MTLTAIEFLRRFVQHVLPRGFVRIRHFGCLASACRTARLTLIRRLLTQPAPVPSDDATPTVHWTCPHCGASMIIGTHLTAARLVVVGRGIDSS
jgi:hypothetical protein